jgi:CBS domain-containing protein
MLVREVMRKPVAVRAEETLQAATARLKQENVGALPVVEGDQLVGMITDRDILLRGGGEGRSIARTKARQAMSIAPLVCHDGDALDHALAVMRSNHVQRLPVLDQNEKLVGVLSVNDFSAPLSDPTAIEVVFYKQLPDSTGHVHNVELSRVAVARCSSKSEAVQAAIREFEEHRRRAGISPQTATTSWSIVPGRLRKSNAYEIVRMHCGSAKAARKGGAKSIGHRPAVRSTWSNMQLKPAPQAHSRTSRPG